LQASYDKMIFKYIALGFSYNYESIQYKVYTIDNNFAETDHKIHTLMSRVRLIYGFKSLKVYHGLALGIDKNDETFTQTIGPETYKSSTLSFNRAFHLTIFGLELHLTKSFYMFADSGFGSSGAANIGAGYMF
nr:hypothetical protein [Spirochaetota bacterium]